MIHHDGNSFLSLFHLPYLVEAILRRVGSNNISGETYVLYYKF